jgi:hypothetical protein
MSIQVLEHQVEQVLRQRLSSLAFVAEATHEQDRMNTHELKSAVATVRDCPSGIKDGLPYLLDKRAVEALCSLTAVTAATEQREQAPGPSGARRPTLGSADRIC